jgi:peptide/nickel transport system ATP-binding protein
LSAVIEAYDLRVSVPGGQRSLWGPRRELEIVHGVDLTVAEGEVLGLVGESGSGKTTLGRALIRLMRPSGGRLLFQGNDITRLDEFALRPLRAKMQMIFQDPHSSLNPRLTIGTTLKRSLSAFARSPDRTERRQRAEEVLETVGLPVDFTRRYPHQLSGGQRQRVGIARAIALQPDFIIADEIVSGLDVSTQAQILLLLRDLQKRLKLTMVFISHDLSVVRVLCDKVAVLKEGQVVEAGACATIFSQPSHPYTRELIDAIPLPDMNQSWWAAA